MWVVARTKACQEHRAAVNVKRQNHPYYLPTYWDRDAKRVRVLFPSYLFVFIEQLFTHLKSTYGIIGLIQTGDVPTPLDSKYIDALRARENEYGHIMLDDEEPEPEPELPALQVNQSVMITSGAFANRIGLCQGMDTPARVKVLFAMLGADRVVTVNRNIVAAV